MENFLVIAILLCFLLLVVYSVIEITTCKQFSKREKTNYLFFVFVLPFAGSLIYFIFLRKSYNIFRNNASRCWK